MTTQAFSSHDQRLHLLDAAIEQTFESIIITTAGLDMPEPRIIFVNPAFTSMTGYSAFEVIGKTPRILQGPATDREFLGRVRAALSAGEAFHGETINYRKDGTPFAIEWHITPIRDVAGTITHFMASQRDITARTQAEARLRESEMRLQLVTDSIPGAVYQYQIDPTGADRFNFMSGGVEDLFELTPAEVIADSSRAWALMLPEAVPAMQASIQLSARTLADWVHEFQIETPSNRRKWIRGTAKPQLQPDQSIVWHGLLTDITDRKAGQAALERAYLDLAALNTKVAHNHALLQAIADGLPDGLLLLDSRGYVLVVNPAMAQLVASTPAVLTGQHWMSWCGQAQVLFPLQVNQARAQALPSRYRSDYTAPAGQRHILDIRIVPLPGPETPVDQMIIHVVDVTEQLQLEAMAIQNERLAVSGTLTATLAHDINTPLQALHSCMDLVAEVGEERRQVYLNIARAEIERISGMLRRMLDLYRPTQSVHVLVDSNDLLQRTGLLLEHILTEHRITLSYQLAANLPRLYARPDELTQVLLNLCTNAIDAMPDGGSLELATAFEPATKPEQIDRIIWTVTDTGCGMSPEVQARIFDPFFTTKPNGVGVGMAISQRIVQHHGGQLRVQSQPGLGSIFTLSFPLNNQPTIQVVEE